MPLAALPNVGLASIAGGKVIFLHATPEYFAEFAAQAAALGAQIVGGCCGTTPAQIEAIRDAFATGRAPARPFVADERELALAPREPQAETALARAFAEGEWVVCVELTRPRAARSKASWTWRGRSTRRVASGSWT